MFKRGFVLLAVSAASLATPLPAVGQNDEPVVYRLDFSRRAESVFAVSTVWPATGAVERTFSLPAWTALYQIRDFAQHLSDFVAIDPANGDTLPVTRADKDSWRVENPSGGAVETHYRIHADDDSPFGAVLGETHAFLNPAIVFTYEEGEVQRPFELEIVDIPEGWTVSTPLAETAPLRYTGASYHVLTDSPFEIGTHDRLGFEQDGVRYDVAVRSMGPYDQPGLLSLLERIVAYQVELMGGAPFDRYLFIFHFTERGGGGMEHTYATAISVSYESVNRDIAAVAGVTAHEFFHAWNVKRIKPDVFVNYDYAHENYTDALWFAEGVTSYYDGLTRVRAGIWSPKEYWRSMSDEIKRLESRPGRFVHSVTDTSLLTWFDRYPDWTRPEVSISYYNKGEILGLLLDIQIRASSGNDISLDDLMSALYTRYNDVYGNGRGYEDTRALEAALQDLTGQDYDAWFDRYVLGTAPLPYDSILALAGLELQTDRVDELSWGLVAERRFEGPMTVLGVVQNGPAASAGIIAGDEIVSIDGQPVTTRRIPQPGTVEEARLTIRRNGESREIAVTPVHEVFDVFRVVPVEDATPEQVAIREGIVTRASRNSTSRTR